MEKGYDLNDSRLGVGHVLKRVKTVTNLIGCF